MGLLTYLIFPAIVLATMIIMALVIGGDHGDDDDVH